jgi:hypothetical protein
MPNKASIAFDRNWKLCKTSTCIPVDTTCGYYLWILPVDTLLLLHTCGDFFIVSYCVLPKSSNDHFMSGIDTATIQQPYILSHLSILRILSTLLLFYSFTLLLLYFFIPHRYRREVATRRKLHEKCMELEGNIRVFCRSRPVLPVDGADAESNKVVVTCTPNGKKVYRVIFLSL